MKAIKDAFADLGMRKVALVTKQKHASFFALISLDVNKLKDDEFECEEIVNNERFLQAMNNFHGNMKHESMFNRV